MSLKIEFYKKIITQMESILKVQVFLVGGSVRDFLLNNEYTDLDFCTSLLPEEVEKKIKDSGRRSYNIGKKFGTIGLKLKLDNGKTEYIEITTLRGEEYDQLTQDKLKRSRKPTVNYITDLKTDLSRRDFTINSLAMDNEGKIIDFFGGQEDLINKVLKTVGNPKLRFREDPLRILRAIRIATKLDLTIEAKTLEYITKLRFELLRVSKERWVIELDKIIVLPKAIDGLNLLMNNNIFGIIIPELILLKNYDQNSPWHDFTLWDHTLKVVNNCPRDNLNLRWAALLHDIAKPFVRTENPKGHSNYINHELLGAEMVIKISDYLKFSNIRKEYIHSIVLNHLNIDCILKQYDDSGKKL